MSGVPPTRRQTIEQQRARFALGRVREVASKKYGGKYRQEVQGLPAMILTNGLGQTLAFLRAKSKGGRADDEHAAAYQHLCSWICLQMGWTGDLLERVTATDVAGYRRAQLEALAVLGWLKRFAEAELPEAGT